jgi:tetratricopeptide (TPR) repeat protein
MRGRARVWAAAAAAAALAGCATPQDHEREVKVPPAQMQQYLADKPARLHPLYENVLTQGQRNAVLNHMRAGLAAMQIGEWDAAERSFDRALAGIETVYADNARAEDARSTWVKENFKDFKGEPYERAMAYYYRGLLYLRAGDYENARAAFKGGLLQDSLAATDSYVQDFALLAYLSGWASHCNGDADLADSAFAEAVDDNARLAAPGDDANLLLLAETGTAPVKVPVGEYGEALAFERGDGFRDRRAGAVLARGDGADGDSDESEELRLTAAEDVFFQANTRGGRQVERILEGQAQFKDAADTVGETAVQGGAAMAGFGIASGNDDATAAGLAAIGIGLIAKGIAAATRPEADLRQWDNLPDRVHLAAVSTEPLPDSATVRFRETDGTLVGSTEVAVHSAGACAIAWARAHDAAQIPDDAPGSVAE